MATAPKYRHKNSCPDGWLNAGAKVPVHLTVRQENYCRDAIDVHRFCYNLAVRTHRFCRRNRLLWPSWQDISKAFNACKREDHPFVTQVAAVVATGAFRDFGRAVENWRNPALKARVPRTKRRTLTGTTASLYETFPAGEARRIFKALEFCHTPKRGSWLNMAEIEFSVLTRACLQGRKPDEDALPRAIGVSVRPQRSQGRHQLAAHWPARQSQTSPPLSLSLPLLI